MGTMDSQIVPGYSRYVGDTGAGSVTRRNKLKTFALAVAQQARAKVITDLEGFVGVAIFASLPFSGLDHDLRYGEYKNYLQDLRRVLIGDGFTTSERNSGDYALPFQAFLDSGFKPEFQDGGNQVQHAMAGIYISDEYGFLGEKFVKHQEDEAADLALYDAAFEIGSNINKDNFKLLPFMIRDRLRA